MNRALRRSVAGIICILALGACRGGREGVVPAITEEVTTTLARLSRTVPPVDTRFSGQGSAAFCHLGESFNQRFARFDPASGPAELRASMVEARIALEQASTSAPREIKADVEVLVTAFVELVNALEIVNFDPYMLDPASFSRLQGPDFSVASQRLDAYLRNICGAE